MCHRRWIWPLVAGVAAAALITLDYGLPAHVRVWIWSVIAAVGVTAFGCWLVWQWQPPITKRQGEKSAPGEGQMFLSLEVRGNPAAKPSSKEAKKVFEARVEDAYQFFCYTLAADADETASVPQLLAERELYKAKLQTFELENTQLREQVDKQVPDLVDALAKASASIHAAGRTPKQAITHERPAKRPKQEKSAREERVPPPGTGDEGTCGLCTKVGKGKGMRRVLIMDIVRDSSKPNEKENLWVCAGGHVGEQGSCEYIALDRGRGRRPTDAELAANRHSASTELAPKAEPEFAGAS